MNEHRIPKKSAASFHVMAGEAFVVINPKGEQIADLIAFNAHDHSEVSSQAYTRQLNGGLRISLGDSIYTTEGENILTIGEDDCGVHDILHGPCTEWMLEDLFQPEPGGCRENLALAVEHEGIAETQIPNTLNIFQKSVVSEEEQDLELGRSPADPGDSVEFKAEQDALVAISACSAAGFPNGDRLSPIDIRVSDGTTIHNASVQDRSESE